MAIASVSAAAFAALAALAQPAPSIDVDPAATALAEAVDPERRPAGVAPASGPDGVGVNQSSRGGDDWPAGAAAGSAADPADNSEASLGDWVDEPPAGPPAFDGETDEEVVDRVFGYLSELTTLQAGFVQVAPSGGVSEGRLWLRRPRQLRMAYGDPDDPQLLIVATQGNVYVTDFDLDTTDFYPVGRTPLRFILGGDVDRDAVEVVEVRRGVDLIEVTFRDPSEDAEGELSLVFEAPALRLVEWAVVDPQGGLTVVALENVEEGGEVSNRLFRVPDAGGAFLDR